jgi:spore coat polysaccharide biosynthesis protein SpsF
MTSTRLPGKVLTPILGKPMLELMVERVLRVEALDNVIVATTTNSADDAVSSLASRLGIDCYRGSEDDVLNRVLEAAQAYEAEVIVELTGDSPLIDPAVISRVIETYYRSGADYVANILLRTYPIGMDTQVFATDVLSSVAQQTDDPTDHEHVSLYIYRHPELFNLKNVAAPEKLARTDLRLTLDTPEDLALIKAVYEALYFHKPAFGLSDVISFLDSRPDIASLNATIEQREVSR